MIKLNEPFDVTAWGILGLAGIVAATAVSGTWIVAKSVESNELDAYRKGKEWKAAEAITAIAELSKAAKLDASERSELLALRTTSTQAETALKAAIAERDALREVVSGIAKPIDTFELPIGEARFLISNTTALGVTNIYKSVSTCEVRLGSSNIQIVVGQSHTFALGSLGYSITLLKLSEKVCTFSFAQNSKKAPNGLDP